MNSISQNQRRLQYSTSNDIFLGIQYPHGVIKKTWAHGFPQQTDEISIDQVLQKDDLTIAVLSTYQINVPWIMSKLSSLTRVYWVFQNQAEAIKLNLESKNSPNYKFCFPPMKGNVKIMHSKLQLLAHPSHLRIVVPTANLVPYDWGETGIMENMCFLIDLPRHQKGKSTNEENLTHFGRELIHFLRAMTLPEKLIESLRNFDFSLTGKLGFIHSIGGNHMSTSLKPTGYCGLAATVRELDLQTQSSLHIDFVTSSLGKITQRFIENLYQAAQGIYVGETAEMSRAKNSLGTTLSTAEGQVEVGENVRKFCRIYFPTRETVEKSLGGLTAGGTICFQHQWWTSNDFVQHLIRDTQSRRKGMLMHNKIWFVRPVETVSHRQRSWAYIGSANLSESAWGRVVKDTKTKQVKLYCANWECGVIFPVTSDNINQIHHVQDEVHEVEKMTAVFRGHVPVPMIVPGAAYEGKEPWFFSL